MFETEPGIEIPYNVEINDSRLRLKLNSQDYLQGGERKYNERINYGLIMHELFSSVTCTDDIIPGLDRLSSAGRISAQQRDLLEERIKTALKDEKILSWFDPGNEVRTESGILVKGGELRRPDRVIVNKNGTTIIDFKFGEESYSHQKQLKYYSSLLDEMGYRNIKAYLWYVEQGRIEEVAL